MFTIKKWVGSIALLLLPASVVTVSFTGYSGLELAHSKVLDPRVKSCK